MVEAGSRGSCPWSEWAIWETDHDAALGCVMRANTLMSSQVTGEAVGGPGQTAGQRPGPLPTWAEFKVSRWY